MSALLIDHKATHLALASFHCATSVCSDWVSHEHKYLPRYFLKKSPRADSITWVLDLHKIALLFSRFMIPRVNYLNLSFSERSVLSLINVPNIFAFIYADLDTSNIIKIIMAQMSFEKNIAELRELIIFRIPVHSEFQ